MVLAFLFKYKFSLADVLKPSLAWTGMFAALAALGRAGELPCQRHGHWPGELAMLRGAEETELEA